MLMFSTLLLVLPAVSVTVMFTGYSPTVVAAPEIFPLSGFRTKPAGRPVALQPPVVLIGKDPAVAVLLMILDLLIGYSSAKKSSAMKFRSLPTPNL